MSDVLTAEEFAAETYPDRVARLALKCGQLRLENERLRALCEKAGVDVDATADDGETQRGAER